MKRARLLPPLLTAETARLILEGVDRISFDLGLSEVGVNIGVDGVGLPDGSVVGLGDLERVADRSGAVFFPREGGLFQVAISDGHYYKLVPTEGAPTLEIDGVQMHRTKGTTPDADSAAKIDALDVDGGRVLDTCTGLGYTALESLSGGGELVVTVEVRPEVLRMAELNPWSSGLFTDRRVHKLVGDVYALVGAFPDGFFDYIVHDPPRLSHAGELYSGRFYAKLGRVLRSGGRLFHYTGEPGSRYRRLDVRRGVMQRLREAGFRGLRYHGDVMGVTGVKV